MNLSKTAIDLCDFFKTKEEWDVKRYTDKIAFQALWSINDDNAQKNGPLENNKLIVWDGFPEKEESDNSLVNFERYLTPIDWVLAYSCYWFKKNKDEDQQLKIVIVDVCSHNYSQNLNLYRYILQNISYVKFYSFNNKDFPEALSPLELENNLKPASGSWDYEKAKLNLEELSDLWQCTLVKSGEKDNTHHSINNVLGPMMLEETLSKEIEKISETSTRRAALKQCLKWHNVIEQLPESIGETTNSDTNYPKLSDDTELVLIDDQAKQDGINWVDIVYGWVYGKLPDYKHEDGSVGPDVYRIGQGQEMIYSVSPQFVIDKLNNFVIDELANIKTLDSVRFRLNFTEKKNAILLFDLYLFPTNDQKEIDYFNNVIETTLKCIVSLEKGLEDVIKKLEESKKAIEIELFYAREGLLEKAMYDLELELENVVKIQKLKLELENVVKRLKKADEVMQSKFIYKYSYRGETLKDEKKVMQGFKGEIEALEKKIESLEDSECLSENDRLSGLTILPRLVALIDPSIPIIIFSSTGKRGMIEKFKGYNNIITCFEKPRVLGHCYVDAKLTRYNFDRALEEARWFIDVRKYFQGYLSLSDFGAKIELEEDEKKKALIKYHLGSIVWDYGISRQDFFRLVIQYSSGQLDLS